jgi:tetrahydromethanopterin S-methyltransferase subunit B
MKSLLDLVQSKTRGIQLIKQKLEYDSVSLVVKANQIQANQTEIESIINEMDQLQEQILEIETIVNELEKYLFEFQ